MSRRKSNEEKKEVRKKSTFIKRRNPSRSCKNKKDFTEGQNSLYNLYVIFKREVYIMKEFFKKIFKRKRKCPNKNCNYNTGKGKCTLDICHYKNRAN